MKSFRTLLLFSLLMVGAAFVRHAHATVLANDTRLVAASAALASASTSGAFTLANPGTYRLTVSDTGFPAPSALTSVTAVVTLGSAVVAQLNLTSAGQTVAKDFTGVPGDYKIFAIGKASGVAEARLSVALVDPNTNNTGALIYGGVVDMTGATSSSGQTDVQTAVHVSAAGTYSLTLADRQFPAALQDYNVIVVDRANSANFAQFSAPTTTLNFTAAAAGDFDLIVATTPDTTSQAGLFSVTVTGPGTVANGATTYAVGNMPQSALISFPAGADTLSLTDLNFPAALSAVKAILVQDDRVLAQASQSGTTPISNAQAGQNAVLYSLATSASAGTYSRQLLQGQQVLYGDVRTSAAVSFIYPVTITTAAQYTVQLKDFGFPVPLTSLQAVVSQNGTSLTTMAAAGSVDLQLATGSVEVLVLPQAATTDNSLFGLSITTKGSGTKVLEKTQGIGQLFDAIAFTVTDAGSYDVSLADLKFPAQLAQLAVAVTRGPTLVGQIFGGGKFSFNATPGDYTLNFIAKAGGTPAEYGVYTASVATSPPAPTVTLNASPTSVSSQGTTLLSWSTTNADSCTASGSWSGTKTTSGSESSAALTADSTFTLTCSGPGGSATTSATVTIATKSSSGGGGGSVSLELIALLGALAAARRRRLRH